MMGVLGGETGTVFIRVSVLSVFPSPPASQCSVMFPLLKMGMLSSEIPTAEKTQEFDEGCGAIVTTYQRTHLVAKPNVCSDRVASPSPK